jgi:hypothetical protein
MMNSAGVDRIFRTLNGASMLSEPDPWETTKAVHGRRQGSSPLVGDAIFDPFYVTLIAPPSRSAEAQVAQFP